MSLPVKEFGKSISIWAKV